MPFYRPITIFAACFCVAINAHATIETTFKKALDKKMISVQAVSNGGYIGKCLSVQLQNNTDEALNIKVDPALIFAPSDSSYQDLVSVGGEVLALAPKKKGTVSLQTFCGKSYAYSPKKNLSYKFRRQGNEAFQSVTEYIRANKIFNYLGQHAVWMFTNKHSIRSVYDVAQNETSKRFLNFITSVLNIGIPEYHIKYRDRDTTKNVPVFDPVIESYYVDISWNINTARTLRIGVFKEDGTLYKSISKMEHIDTTGHHAIVNLYPATYPDGKYYVRLYDDDNQVYVQKTVLIGEQYNYY